MDDKEEPSEPKVKPWSWAFRNCPIPSLGQNLVTVGRPELHGCDYPKVRVANYYARGTNDDHHWVCKTRCLDFPNWMYWNRNKMTWNTRERL